MRTDTSFSQKLRAGWTKKQLMEYYVMTDREYQKVTDSLKGIRKVV